MCFDINLNSSLYLYNISKLKHTICYCYVPVNLHWCSISIHFSLLGSFGPLQSNFVYSVHLIQFGLSGPLVPFGPILSIPPISVQLVYSVQFCLLGPLSSIWSNLFYSVHLDHYGPHGPILSIPSIRSVWFISVHLVHLVNFGPFSPILSILSTSAHLVQFGLPWSIYLRMRKIGFELKVPILNPNLLKNMDLKLVSSLNIWELHFNTSSIYNFCSSLLEI